METDRTGAMLRDTYHCCSCIVSGVFSLAIFGGTLVVLHEKMLPTGMTPSENIQRIVETAPWRNR
ncbi:hypothetical protein [Synechococcus phage S-N03]|uniref:Uncharacterized protein n=1 Tax=Synechococcus phage S-N03 TaxID=2718943 RepID=A0A6G8R5I0_9CAUD|nr:hypothetical protein PQC09_gp020 [Synechococcus phage S-N03]QIN96655.1 hypothetical protein [Synechococcus phage S-N03]